MKTQYVAEVISQGGRTGTVESASRGFSAKLHGPAEDGSDGSTTPEDLFGAAYAACFHSAVANAAERAHLKLEGSTITARVALDENDQGGYQLGIELRASLPGIDEAQAKRLLHQAHQTCPYSKAVRGNVDVKLTLD